MAPAASGAVQRSLPWESPQATAAPSAHPLETTPLQMSSAPPRELRHSRARRSPPPLMQSYFLFCRLLFHSHQLHSRPSQRLLPRLVFVLLLHFLLRWSDSRQGRRSRLAYGTWIRTAAVLGTGRLFRSRPRLRLMWGTTAPAATFRLCFQALVGETSHAARAVAAPAFALVGVGLQE